MNTMIVQGERDGEPQTIAGERRGDRRYEIRLDIRWRLIRRRRVLDAGQGRTLDLSSSGLLLETDKQLPVGLHIEVSISWPVLLHKVAPLQLVVAGRVVRSEGNRAAIRMSQHEFRTVGLHSSPRTSLRGGGRPSAAYFSSQGVAGLGKVQ